MYFKIIKAMRKVIFYILSGLLICNLLLTSCVDCIDGNDRIVEQTRVFDNLFFDEVISNGNFDVEIIQDNSYDIVVKADDNVLPYINTYVQGNKLYIENKNNKCYSTNNRPVIFIYSPTLSFVKMNGSGNIHCNRWIDNTLELDLELSGSGNIVFEGLLLKTLFANVSGSGIIELYGTTKTGDLSISGSGKIKAFSLDQDDSYATISGSGNIYTFFYNLLDVEITGSGNVFYKGDSRYVSWKITGSGSVINNNKK